MNIDEESIKALCGTSNKIVVFGFGRYKYIEACEAINKIKGIQAVHSDDYQYKHEVFDKRQPYSMNAYFKYIPNDLVLENYKRKQQGEPIIPLIFIIGFEEDECSLEQVTKRQEKYDKWVTLTELRRCYKLAHEFGNELTEVANETFKFVKLKQGSNGYQLQMVSPLWQSQDWEKHWSKRKQSTEKAPGSEYKYDYWRERFSTLANNLKDKKQSEDEAGPSSPDSPKQ
ncbi:hypothetical protein [Legionella tucsonensis]|uniref:Uncharacterized protein n=1 Tax=Legionella tucsonensis TaxID=40335 RepID=A0A0W0ZTM2_9GAMM|nr:hypothetical protein [Legionella tucsonensis]KTD72517.1 hypothetical protein Ltuc_0364 [Legionella tucsonensis]